MPPLASPGVRTRQPDPFDALPFDLHPNTVARIVEQRGLMEPERPVRKRMRTDDVIVYVTAVVTSPILLLGGVKWAALTFTG